MFDFFKLPSLAADEVDTTEADEKAERIRFHREKVRNGPVKFSTPTNGQLRRAEKRAGQRALKKRRQEQVRSYFAREREASVLRGQLQAIGVLPYFSGGKPSEQHALTATKWIVQRYGELERSDADLIRNAVQKTYDRYCDLMGQERSEIEYAA